jgi:hypothetical protein
MVSRQAGFQRYCKNLDVSIQTVGEYMMTAADLHEPVILSQRRRICAQVETPHGSARSFVPPRMTTPPKT